MEEYASYNTLARRHGINASTIRHVIQYLGAYA
jgi:transposase-like protein